MINWSQQRCLRNIFQKSQTSYKLTFSKQQSFSGVTDSPSAVREFTYIIGACQRKHKKYIPPQGCLSRNEENLYTGLEKQFIHRCAKNDRNRLLRNPSFRISSNNIHTTTVTKTFVKNGPPWRVMFFGTDKFSSQVLKILTENRFHGNTPLIEKLEVVANVGETRVRQFAASAGLPVHDWPLSDQTGCYDVGVLASFGHMIPSRILTMFPHGILNVHPSLLPRWRGASPIVHTILSGDQVTGVSIMKLRPKHFDTGTLLAQMECPVPSNTTSSQLRDMLAQQGGQLLLGVLQALPHVKETEQSEDGVTYAHKVTSAMAFIDWEKQTCDDIDRQYRALGEFLPLRSEMEGNPVKLLDMRDITHNYSEDDRPGTVLFDKKRKILCIKCWDGWVGFENIVIRKTMSAQAFYNGYLSKIAPGKKLCLTSVCNGLDTENYGKRILQRR